MQTQARPITRPQSIKDTFSDFAETMTQKLKSYLKQCNVYQNQSLRGNIIVIYNVHFKIWTFIFSIEFRELLEKFEIVSSKIPFLILNDIYLHNSNELNSELVKIKEDNEREFKQLEKERVGKVLFNKFTSLTKIILFRLQTKAYLDQT